MLGTDRGAGSAGELKISDAVIYLCAEKAASISQMVMFKYAEDEDAQKNYDSLRYTYAACDILLAQLEKEKDGEADAAPVFDDVLYRIQQMKLKAQHEAVRYRLKWLEVALQYLYDIFIG